jgi:hypothetical protein
MLPVVYHQFSRKHVYHLPVLRDNQNSEVGKQQDGGGTEVSNLIVRNCLFWDYDGKKDCSWYLCGDDSSDAKREAYIRYAQARGVNTVLLCLNNEGCMSVFRDGFMKSLDMAKVNTVLRFCKQLQNAGMMPAITFYDGPAIPGARYHPILDCPDETHAEFIKAACKTLNPYVGLYLIGCETNRYWSTEKVETAIAFTKLHAGLHPVGTHEHCGPSRVFPRSADFCCYETANHPKDGDNVSVNDMVTEVKALQTRLPAGMPVWVGEKNWNDSQRSKEQGRALAEIPGVLGMDGSL